MGKELAWLWSGAEATVVLSEMSRVARVSRDWMIWRAKGDPASLRSMVLSFSLHIYVIRSRYGRLWGGLLANRIAFGRWDAFDFRRIRCLRGALRVCISFIERLVNFKRYVSLG